MYRKTFAGVALATSMLVTTLVGGVAASTQISSRAVTGHNSLGGTQTSVSESLSTQSLNSHHLGVSSVTYSVRSSSERSVALAKSAGISATASFKEDSKTTAETTAIPQKYEVSQDVGDPFEPLNDEEIRERLLLDPNAVLNRPRAVPSSGFLTPSAYGADWGDLFVGLSGISAGNRNDIDGSASVGMGFGSAVNNIGIELNTGIISLDGAAEDGSVGFKLHKVFPQANNFAVALGWSNPITWGNADKSEDTFYGVVTQRFDLDPGELNPVPLTVSLGVGTGTFRSIGAIAAGSNDPNFFGSIGVRVRPDLSVISSWTGSSLGMGMSAAPFDAPIVFTAGFSDVTDNTVEGPRFSGSVGYSLSFR